MDCNIQASVLVRTKEEDKQSEGPCSFDRDSKQRPQPSIKKPSKYSKCDDFELLRYVRSRPNRGHTSRQFWKQAIEVDFLLNKTRTIESLRDRYRNYLRNYTEEDFLDLKKSVESSGLPGKADIKIERPGCSAEFIPSRGTMMQANSGFHEVSEEKKNHSEFRTSDISRDHIKREFSDNTSNQAQISQGSNLDHQPMNRTVSDVLGTDELAEQIKLPVSNVRKPSASKAQENGQDLLNTKSSAIVNENRDKGAVKRNYYSKMLEIDQLMRQKKVLKEDIGITKTPDTDFINQCFRSFLPDRNHLMGLFYYCSMDQDNLDRYLQGETYLLWTDQEDQLILGPTKEIGKVILSRYKGVHNVVQRIEFLERYEACKRSIIQQLTKSGQ